MPYEPLTDEELGAIKARWRNTRMGDVTLDRHTLALLSDMGRLLETVEVLKLKAQSSGPLEAIPAAVKRGDYAIHGIDADTMRAITAHFNEAD